MPRAIVTSFIPPTNHKGARLSVRSSADTRTIVAWDDALGTDENHARAARILANRLAWGSDRIVSANLPGGKGAMVHVVVKG